MSTAWLRFAASSAKGSSSTGVPLQPLLSRHRVFRFSRHVFGDAMSAASDAASVQNMLTTDASSRSLEEFAFPDVELDPVAVLMDELKHEDIGLRVNAVKHLAAIAAALGIERTRSELIPFLSDTSEEADEVLAVVAEELGCFAEAVGGAAHAHILLPILGRFAGEEDMQTREKAIESLLAVSALISRETAQTALFPIIEALATHEWFPRKQSAAVLIPKTFSMFSREKQTRLVTLFVALVHDDMPMVRRVAAVNFPVSSIVSLFGKFVLIVCRCCLK